MSFAARKLSVLVVVAVTSCQVIGGFDDLAFEPAATSAGTGGGGGSGGAEPECGVSPPLRPESDGEGTPTEFSVAVRSVDFGEGNLKNGPQIGYDLDFLCTECSDRTGEPIGDVGCVVPDFVASQADLCDGPDGRDNNLAKLLSSALLGPVLSSSAISDKAATGRWTVLLRVSDYNGLSNDDDVQLAIYASDDLGKEPCFNGTEPATPMWNGEDRWPILSDSVDGDAPALSCDMGPLPAPPAKYKDTNAYVSNGVLVASIANAEFTVAASSFIMPFRFQNGIVTGELVEEDGRWRLTNGIIAGRLALTEVFRSMSRVSDPTTMSGTLCTGTPTYDFVRSTICGLPDISVQLGLPTAECNAISYAIAVETAPVQLGNVIDPVPFTNECPDGTDPADDMCGT